MLVLFFGLMFAIERHWAAPQQRTMILTYSEVPQPSGATRVSFSGQEKPCRIGDLWRDSEGDHECVEYSDPKPGDCRLGSEKMNTDGTWSRCVPTNTWEPMGQWEPCRDDSYVGYDPATRRFSCKPMEPRQNYNFEWPLESVKP